MAAQQVQSRLSSGFASPAGICFSTERRAAAFSVGVPSSFVSSTRVALKADSSVSVSFSSAVSSVEHLNCGTSSARLDRRRLTAVGVARAALFPFLGKLVGKDKDKVKMELFTAIAPLARGATATSDDVARVDQIAQELEKLNPTKEPLSSPLLNGKWKLIYTTSDSILKKSRPEILRPSGPIYQAINADTLRAQNVETWPFFNQVTADLEPVSGKKVVVKFDVFKIGGLCPFSRQRNFYLGASDPTSKAKRMLDTCFEEPCPVVGGGYKESCKEDSESPEHEQPSVLSEELLQNSLYNRNLKWCELCGGGNGWMMCGSCMGDGGYATRPGLAAATGKVGWARCKTCFGLKILPCPVCSPIDQMKS